MSCWLTLKFSFKQLLLQSIFIFLCTCFAVKIWHFQCIIKAAANTGRRLKIRDQKQLEDGRLTPVKAFKLIASLWITSSKLSWTLYQTQESIADPASVKLQLSSNFIRWGDCGCPCGKSAKAEILLSKVNWFHPLIRSLVSLSGSCFLSNINLEF